MNAYPRRRGDGSPANGGGFLWRQPKLGRLCHCPRSQQCDQPWV